MDSGARCVSEFLDSARVDIWLFTEVNAGWETSHGSLAVSPPRVRGRAQDRWAGIQTRLPITQLSSGGPNLAAAEEALCLARVQLPGHEGPSSVLVACTVLPWSGAGRHWPGLPSRSLDDQAAFVLDHHIARIEGARLPGEPLIWGGDFNQALRRPSPERAQAGFRTTGTVKGIARLEDAFDRFDLHPLTKEAPHRIPGADAIDHLAVSRWVRSDKAVDVRRLDRPDGTRLSDHATYIAEIDL